MALILSHPPPPPLPLPRHAHPLHPSLPPSPSLRRSSRISTRRQSSSSIPTPRPPLRLVLSSERPPSPIHPSARSTNGNSNSSRPRSRSRSRLPQKPLPSAPSPVRTGIKRKRPATDAIHPDAHTDADQCDLPRYELVLPSPSPSSRSLSPHAQTPRQLRYAKRQRLLSPFLSSSSSPDSPRPRLPAVDVSLPSQRPQDEHCSPSPPSEPEHAASPAEHSISDSSTLDALSTEEELSESDEDADPDAPVFTPLSRLPVSWRHRTPDSTDPVLWKTLCQERVEHLKTVYRDVFRAVIQAEADTYPTFHPQETTAEAQVAQNEGTVQFEHYTPPQYVDADGDSAMSEPAVTPSQSEDMDETEDDEDDEDEDDSELSESDADTPPPEYEHVMILDTPPAAAVPAPTPTPSPIALVAPHTTTPAHRHRLPRLASIRVYGLEPFPPASRNGVPFIGRGTPADRQRLADWAAPPQPLPFSLPLPLYVSPRSSMSPHASLSPEPMAWGPATGTATGVGEGSSPEPVFFTEDMIPQPPQPSPSLSSQGMTAEFGMNGMNANMTWLDPALRAESLSPSPSPSPAPPSFPSSSPSPSQTYTSFPSPFACPPPAFSSGEDMSPNSNLMMCGGGGMQLGPLSPTGTGCALHESFLECLQAPGCACAGPGFAAGLGNVVAGPNGPSEFPFFSSSLGPAQAQMAFAGVADGPGAMGTTVSTGMGMGAGASISGVMDAGVGAAIGMGVGASMSASAGVGATGGIAAVFPNQELAQFVRAHLVPAGSVTLSHALG
ncbi:hypothetical protein GY45DRAFT_283486 [Cubamyces sp. BRFM 1775]|nr:hypothetical protein GY45DRAFT_283486 [Cubamyces sp. BRFM 1775]